MKVPYQWTSAGIGIVTAVVILYLVRRDRVQVRYALWWLTVACAAVVLGVFPHWINIVGRLLGVHYPPILVVLIGLALLLIKSLTQDIDRCRREQNMRRLAQRIALLEGQLKNELRTPSRSNSTDEPGPTQGGNPEEG